MRFLREDEALKAIRLFDGESDSKGISKGALKNWVVWMFLFLIKVAKWAGHMSRVTGIFLVQGDTDHVGLTQKYLSILFIIFNYDMILNIKTPYWATFGPLKLTFYRNLFELSKIKRYLNRVIDPLIVNGSKLPPGIFFPW